MIKYTIVGYIILCLVLLYEINMFVDIKKDLDKKVLGAKTQMKEFEDIQNMFSENY